jgi:hypothetical protein
VSAVLLTRLKITDLTALTALEAGQRMLPEGLSLDRVVREELFLFEPDAGATAATFEAKLHEAVESSNFFVNPNKERFRLLTSSDRGAAWTPPPGAWGLVARSRDDTRDEGLLARLSREHPLPGGPGSGGSGRGGAAATPMRRLSTSGSAPSWDRSADSW